MLYLNLLLFQYVPLRGESVIGTVVKKGSDEIQLDFGSSELAVVDLLSFEGATKRNKPNIKVILSFD